MNSKYPAKTSIMINMTFKTIVFAPSYAEYLNERKYFLLSLKVLKLSKPASYTSLSSYSPISIKELAKFKEFYK